MKSRTIAFVFTASIAVQLSGCISVGPDYTPPQPDLPDAWHQSLMAGLADGESNIHQWWTHLNDPLLEDLIGRVAAGNLDLRQAFLRIKQSRALRGIATSERYPALDGVGGFERSRESEGISSVPAPPQSRTDNFTSVGLNTTWELDFWGRISRSIESADAELSASYEDYRDLLVLLYAEVALNYVEVRSLQDRIRYADSNVETQRGTLKLTTDRFDAEIAPELDVRQAELNLASTESAIPTLKRFLAQAVHRLGVLLGEEPGSLDAELAAPASIPLPPELVAVGVPADLLRQRPDIRSAERQLAAQTARIGIATADLYPQFSLDGFFEYQTSGGATGSLTQSKNRAWSFGPSFRWQLFNGGRVRNNIAFQDARTEELLARYEQTVLQALEDVENSMVAYVQERDRRDALARSVTAAARSVELVTALYRTGLTDFQNVLDMERSRFVQQDLLAESEGAVTQNLISVYRALGGGWEPQPEELANEIEDAETNGEPVV